MDFVEVKEFPAVHQQAAGHIEIPQVIAFSNLAVSEVPLPPPLEFEDIRVGDAMEMWWVNGWYACTVVSKQFGRMCTIRWLHNTGGMGGVSAASMRRRL